MEHKSSVICVGFGLGALTAHRSLYRRLIIQHKGSNYSNQVVIVKPEEFTECRMLPPCHLQMKVLIDVRREDFIASLLLSIVLPQLLLMVWRSENKYLIEQNCVETSKT